jgi:hypothetical protein
VKLIDKTNGYIFSGIEASAVEFSKIAVSTLDWDYYRYPCFLLILNIIFLNIFLYTKGDWPKSHYLHCGIFSKYLSAAFFQSVLFNKKIIFLLGWLLGLTAKMMDIFFKR